MLLDVNTRTMNAVRFVQQEQNSLWLVLGQPTAWSAPYSDASPPADNPNAASVNSPACAIKATPILVYEDDVNGSVSFIDANGVTRKFVQVGSISDAIAAAVTMVLLTATTPGSNLVSAGLSTFRQAAFVTNLVPTTGNETASFLTAAQVSSWGNIETIENSVPQSVIQLDTYEFAFIYQN